LCCVVDFRAVANRLSQRCNNCRYRNPYINQDARQQGGFLAASKRGC
jgi:hypothetical protein